MMIGFVLLKANYVVLNKCRTFAGVKKSNL
jgi:hypothetical protein